MVSRCYLGKRKNIPVFNANRNHSEMLRIQLEPESSSPVSVRTEKQASCMVGRTQNGALSSSSNVRVTIGPSNSTPRCTAEKTEHTHPHKNLYTNVHRRTIHNSQRWDQPKCPSAGDRHKQCGPSTGDRETQCAPSTYWNVTRP